MGLQRLLAALRDDLARRDHTTTFLSRRTGAPALAGHGSLSSVLAFLDDDTPETFAAREVVLRALLVEHRRSARVPPTSTWASALLVAFAPMLGALRTRLRGDAFAPDELDQLVLDGFLAALARCPVNAPSLCWRLRHDTQRFVMRALVREQQRRVAQRILEDHARGNGAFLLFEWRGAPAELDDDERAELEVLLRSVVAGAVEEPRLEVVVATRLRGQPLHAVPGAERGRGDRGYERVKRERTRTLQQLRALLIERLSPPDGDLALDLSRLRAAS